MHQLLMPPHDIARTLDRTSTRHTVVNHRHDIAMLVAHKGRDLVLESTPLVGRRAFLCQNLQRDWCSVWARTAIDATSPTFADQLVDNIDSEGGFESKRFLQLRLTTDSARCEAQFGLSVCLLLSGPSL